MTREAFHNRLDMLAFTRRDWWATWLGLQVEALVTESDARGLENRRQRAAKLWEERRERVWAQRGRTGEPGRPGNWGRSQAERRNKGTAVSAPIPQTIQEEARHAQE